ncbi:hypothetical protein G6F55_009905 [Rhizopus delemar]|nr:hypothetical protein G6F55_009905 [Rhizopus delemar]KAG1505645.1 hypothetical protein G6F53_010140 [Rhizopus delemar]KAG1566312.1 hypothetical protein G6F50_009265 [Rhizopus delemar]KAG1589172.1 hypothetical protein G6F47_010427 [Rhizopus delemar]KAG1631179.1 hypothetical protein G6F44_011109 [Rhizopus delemar]
MAVPRTQTSGQAVLRLVQFAEQLNPGEQAMDRSFWDSFVQDFYTSSSSLKLGLLNIESNERRVFEVNQSLLARCLHTQYMCSISSVQMTLGKTAEYIFPGGIMNVECPKASIVYKYDNGILVVITGHLIAQFVMSSEGIWKIEHMDFSCQGFEEYIDRASIRSEPIPNSKKKTPPHHSVFPDSPINKWGLPPKLFHILQISDIAERLGEVAFHSIVTGLGPQDSLSAIAFHKQQELVKDNDNEESKLQLMHNLAMRNMASSPVVKTQTGARPQQTFTPQQQAAIRQQQMHAALQQPPTTPHYQPTYPANNQFTTTPTTPSATTSPMTRKRNSIASDTKPPAARKRANNARKQQQ